MLSYICIDILSMFRSQKLFLSPMLFDFSARLQKILVLIDRIFFLHSREHNGTYEDCVSLTSQPLNTASTHVNVQQMGLKISLYFYSVYH